MKTIIASLISLTLLTLTACAPEVGSERWCAELKEKPKMDWSTNEAKDYASNCAFEGDDEERG